MQALRLYCLKCRRRNPVIRYDVYISGLCIIIIFNEIIELVPLKKKQSNLNFLKVYTFTCMSSTKIKNPIREKNQLNEIIDGILILKRNTLISQVFVFDGTYTCTSRWLGYPAQS